MKTYYIVWLRRGDTQAAPRLDKIEANSRERVVAYIEQLTNQSIDDIDGYHVHILQDVHGYDKLPA
jgi:hypothetical protein